MEFSAIILAAGKGARMGLEYNKIFHPINGRRVLDYSVDFFREFPSCKELILVCSDNDFNQVYDLYHTKVNTIIIGGKTRQESVFKGLNKAKYPYVLVHDSARPFLNPDSIHALVKNLEHTQASTLAVPVKDTIVKVTENRLSKTLDRNELVALQTPQGFSRELLLNAHQKAKKAAYSATDDTDLVRKFTSVMPSYVMGDYRSIKLTTKEDIAFLEVIL